MVALILAVILTWPAQPAADGCTSPRHREFDFWLGTWEVTDPAGKLQGTNRIERIEGGCAIQETWTGANGMTGRSVNAYQPATGRWHQMWVSNRGSVLIIDGRFDGRSMFPRRAVWIQHEGGHPFVADPTCITLYNPRASYERRALDPDGDHSDWFEVPEAVVRDVVARHDRAAAESPARILRYTRAPARPEPYLAHRRLHEYLRRHPAPDLLLVEEAVIHLFASTIDALYAQVEGRRRPPAAFTRAHRDLVEAVRAHLNLTFTGTHSLDTIAQAVGTSVFHLCRVFRRGTGETLHAYRHQLRLHRALQQLDDERDLLALALELGYSGHSHFTAAFRRRFGVAPSTLRDWTDGDRRPTSSRRGSSMPQVSAVR